MSSVSFPKLFPPDLEIHGGVTRQKQQGMGNTGSQDSGGAPARRTCDGKENGVNFLDPCVPAQPSRTHTCKPPA